MDRNDIVVIKGTRHGLSVLLDDRRPYPRVLAEFVGRIREAPSFFRGARMTVDLGRRDVTNEQIAELTSTLENFEITLQGVVAAMSGPTVVRDLALQSPEIRLEEPDSLERPLMDSRVGEALLIRRTVPSAEIVRYPGHICVIGDVDPRAQLSSGGDVVVWGKLEGMVRAGEESNQGAVVCALVLQPSRLSIGGVTGYVSPNRYQRGRPPEVALVRDERIVIEPWGKTRI